MAFYDGVIRWRKRRTLQESRENREMEFLSFARNKIVPSPDFPFSFPVKVVLLPLVEFHFDIMHEIPERYGSG